MADNHIKFPAPGGDNVYEPLAPDMNPPSAEEIFPDLHNEKLVAAMEALKADENPETQKVLIENVLTSKFFAPVDVLDSEGNVLKGHGKMSIPKDAKVNFKLIQNNNGQQFFAIFTDIQEFLKWSKNPQVNTIVVVFPQIAQLALKRSDVISGFVINPLTQNIIFNQDAISGILDSMKAVAEREKERREAAARPQEIKLMFGEPKNIPDAVYGAFRKKLEKIPEVKEAYFSMMKQNEEEFYLFTLDIDADVETCRSIGNSFCESAKLFLTKFPIMAAPVNSPYGEGAKKVGGPFYTKA